VTCNVSHVEGAMHALTLNCPGPYAPNDGFSRYNTPVPDLGDDEGDDTTRLEFGSYEITNPLPVWAKVVYSVGLGGNESYYDAVYDSERISLPYFRIVDRSERRVICRLDVRELTNWSIQRLSRELQHFFIYS
jgi:hypothetical protein